MVPRGTSFKGVALGDWTAEQIEKYERGELNPGHREKLERVGYTVIFKKMEDRRFQRQMKEAAHRPDQSEAGPLSASTPVKPGSKLPTKAKRSKSPQRKTPSPMPEKKQPRETPQSANGQSSKESPTSQWSTENAALGRQQLHWNKMFELLLAYKEENGNVSTHEGIILPPLPRSWLTYFLSIATAVYVIVDMRSASSWIGKYAPIKALLGA